MNLTKMQRKNVTTNFSRANIEHKHLLNNLKLTVETLFLNNKCNSASSTSSSSLLLNHESLLRLHMSIEQIFTNGIRLFKQDNSPDIWRFIEGLNWINPLMTISIANQENLPNIHIPFARIKNDKALCWIYENIQQQKLYQKLKYLISDAEHLSACYEITAFLQNEHYQTALFLCLKAFETNQQNLLTQIDSSLYTDRLLQSNHKRSTSHPNFSFLPPPPAPPTSSSQIDGATITSENKSMMGNKASIPFHYDPTTSCRSSRGDITIPLPPGSSSDFVKPSSSSQRNKRKHHNHRKSKQKSFEICVTNLKLRPWRSLPNLSVPTESHRLRSSTISQPIHIPFQKIRLTAEALAINNGDQKVPSFSYNKQFASDSASSPTQFGNSTNTILQSPGATTVDDLKTISLVKCDDIKIHFDAKHRPLTSASINLSESLSSSNKSPPSSSQRQSSGIFSFINRDSFSLFNTTDKQTIIDSIGSPSFLATSSASSDFVRTFLPPRQGEKIQNRYQRSILDLELSPSESATDTFYNNSRLSRSSIYSNNQHLQQIQQPLHGQSLTSFLQAGQFSRVNNELERENAHFSVSEAMISAIEQIKWTNSEKLRAKQRIKMEAQRSGGGGVKNKKKPNRLRERDWDNSAAASYSFGKAGGTSMSTTASSSTSDSSIDSHFSIDSDETGESVCNDPKYLKALSVSTHSINDHTAYAEWGDNHLDTLSAESVALSLIAKFSDKQLPKASDLLWLVSEQDAPQKILPMPGSWTVSPDETYKIPFTRGTRDWAPPRPQIIFTRHVPVDRKTQLFSQNQRCAGCGMRVAAAYSHRFRYCDYLGKYFCTGCHRCHMSVIPARILDRWDFTNRPVSVFSYRLLEEIWHFPLFRVSDLNKALYTKVRPLQFAKMKRSQLKFIQDFIMSCRFAESLKNLFTTLNSHIAEDLDIWSMADFIAVKNSTFVKDLDAVIQKCENHVFECELCTARGFICELCPRKQVIFPWQPKINRCNNCGVCVHEKCWKSDCAKCERIRKRKQQLADSRKI